MPPDDAVLKESLALGGRAASAKAPALENMQAEVMATRAAAVVAVDDQANAHEKSYLDVALGKVFSNPTTERNVAEAAKAGAIFFGGKVGLATTVALYALDQVKVGDSFGQAVTDIGLGTAKGTVLRGLNTLAATHEFGIVGQAATLGMGSRALDVGLNRRSWIDDKTGAFSMQKGSNELAIAALDRRAIATDIGAFAVGGALAKGVARYTENGLLSSPFWKTTMTGGVFGLATGGTNEVRRQEQAGEQFDWTKVALAGGRQALYNAAAMMPAGAQASRQLRYAFQDSHGVTTIGAKGMYSFGFNGNGQVHEMVSVPAGLKGLREARVQLDNLSAKGQLDLANSFGISFAKHGEPISFGNGVSGRTELIARSPRLNELVAMKEALTKSQPGQLSIDGKTGVKFNFVQDKDAEHVGFGGLFEYQNSVPNVFLHHELSQNKPLTVNDRDPMPRDDGMRRSSLEQVATHEIAHHSDHKVRLQDPKFEADIREKLGWVKVREGELDFHTHVLRGKDGGLYEFNYPTRSWVRTDAQGNHLDAAGKPALPGSEHRISNEEMMRLSEVPPITDYFNNPTEMLMEGFREFRAGGDNRAVLLRHSPTLYEQVRRQDNRELILQYGQNADGQSTMVRLPDGTLSKRDASSEQTISQFEEKAAAQKNAYDTRYQL